VKDKTIFKNGFFAIKKCRNGYFAYNTNDTFIGRSLDLYGEWTQTEIDVLLPLLTPGDIVVDVGAYIVLIQSLLPRRPYQMAEFMPLNHKECHLHF